MLKILLVRLDGFVETSDTWGQMLREEGHEVVLDGPRESAEGAPDVEEVVAVAVQEDVDVVVAPGAEHEWRHDLKDRLRDADVGVAPPECDAGDLMGWVAKRDDGTSGSGHLDEGR